MLTIFLPTLDSLHNIEEDEGAHESKEEMFPFLQKSLGPKERQTGAK